MARIRLDGTQLQTALYTASGERRQLGIVPSCLHIILASVWFEGNEISVACACMRIGRACNGPRMVPTPHYDTDQSRIVYLVRLISIWYCNWFMLFMTLDMPDEGTVALAEDDNSCGPSSTK